MSARAVVIGNAVPFFLQEGESSPFKFYARTLFFEDPSKLLRTSFSQEALQKDEHSVYLYLSQSSYEILVSLLREKVRLREVVAEGVMAEEEFVAKEEEVVVVGEGDGAFSISGERFFRPVEGMIVD